MKKIMEKKLAKRKRKIEKRTKKRNWDNQTSPMFEKGNIHYDFDARSKGIKSGGIGALHQLTQKCGLQGEIDENLNLLKRYLPYHESDHILNIAYNVLSGGTCLQDIELLRNDDAWLNAIGAEIIPDPTTAGDFLRRFDEEQICRLMDVKNDIRRKIWERQPDSFKKEAVVNVDGTICPTCGECKEGMDISYKGEWGYHPLIVSLGNTREPLYMVNRSGNAPSHLDSPAWIDKTLDLVGGCFKKVRLRGDTDFSLTEHFDKWDEKCEFVFGMDARANLVKLADAVEENRWRDFERRPKYTVKTTARKRPENVKDQVVRDRGFRKIETVREQYAEFEYRPAKCRKTYRMVVLKKTIKVVKGELRLFDEIRYFFYITNDREMSADRVLEFYRGRADHENDIEQLKNGVRALQMPSDNLLSNWAYMVVSSLAWDLKAWYGLLMPYRPLGLQIVRMQFKRFLNVFVNIPCLIVKTGRRIVYKLVGYNDKLKHIVNFADFVKRMQFS